MLLHSPQSIFLLGRQLLLIVFIILSVFISSHAQTVVQNVYGNTSGSGAWFYGPIFRNSGNTNTTNYSRHAYIYTATELNIPSGSKIIKLEWLKKDGGTIVGNNSFNVWMSNSSLNAFPSGTSDWNLGLIPGSTQVFSSNTFSITTGSNTYIEAPFIDSFTYNGGSLQILCDWAKLGIANSAVSFYTLSAPGKAQGIASTSATGTNNLITNTYGGARPTMRITYVTVPSCTGTPNPGNTISSDPSICAGISFTLSLQNSLSGSLITYQWQSADDLAFTTNLTTNLGTNSILTTSQTSSKYYRCLVTCGVGPTSNYSTPVHVPMAPSYGCYCLSRPIAEADEDITKFTLGSLKNCSDCGSIAPGVNSINRIYANYQPLTPANIQVGSTIPFSIEISICGTGNYSSNSSIFIDYNQNNSFDDPGELVYSSIAASSGAHIRSGIITIPATANLGLTGVRVINAEQNSPILSPCLIFSYGETEDYLINLTPSSNCSGMPNPGNTKAESQGSCDAVSTTYSLCSGTAINLILENTPSTTGNTFQWYNNSMPILGATSPTYTTLPLTTTQVFHCVVTCTNSNLSASSVPITITMASYLTCYCKSLPVDIGDEEILGFTFNGVTNISDCITLAPGPGSVLNKYGNFTSLGSITNAILGASVPFSINVDDCDTPPAPYFSFATSIWIDYNHNGSFSDFGEQVFVEPVVIDGPRVINGNILIPCTALVGQTRMRISAVEGSAGSALTPCLSYGYGETEDYLINIVQPTLCISPVPNPGNTLASVTILCDSTEVELSLQNKCLLDNYTYQWYKDNIIVSGATNRTYTTPKIFATTSYYCIVSCGISSSLSTSITIVKPNILNVNLNASNATYCVPGGTAIILTSSGSLNYIYSPSNSLTSSTGTSVFATPSTSTTYTVVGTDANGCTQTSTTYVQVVPCATNFSIKLYIQGFYQGAGLMSPALKNQGVGTSLTVTDSITVELRNTTPPYSLVNSNKVILHTNGLATINYPTLGSSYYIGVMHRNGLETWSANPVPGSVGFYDFSISSSKAYGNNMIQVEPNVWAIYSGDVFVDYNIDLLDMSLLENDISAFQFGYQSTDINGDGNVDLLDANSIETNITDFIFGVYP